MKRLMSVTALAAGFVFAGRRLPRHTRTKATPRGCYMSTALVLMMSVPALALFYGGIGAFEKPLSMLMQVFVVFSLVTVLWCIYGYSLASPRARVLSPYFGGFDRLFLAGRSTAAKGESRWRRRSARVRRSTSSSMSRSRPRSRDYLLPAAGCDRRAREIRRRARVHRPLVHLCLCADRAHGVVLDGTGRLYTAKVVR
jgi:hypothetical protein